MNASGSVDRAELLERLGGDLGLLGELVELLAEGWPDHLGALRTAVADDDPDRLARVAHSVRGTVATFASAETAARARAIEMRARDGEAACAAEAVEAFAASVEALIGELWAIVSER